MTTNVLRKPIVQNGESAVVEPGLRKPPQYAPTNDARLVNGMERPAPEIQADSVAKGTRKTAIPATWTEAIQDPQLWAELRPLLVDED